MIFVVQKLLMPTTFHLKIQGCKDVRTMPDLGAVFSAVCTHLSLSLSDQEGIQAQRLCAARVVHEGQDAGPERQAVEPRGEEEAHFLAGSG